MLKWLSYEQQMLELSAEMTLILKGEKGLSLELDRRFD